MQDSSTDNISSRSISTSTSGENDSERAVFKSQHSIEAKKLIEYNSSLKLNIEDLFITHIDANIFTHVIKKKSKSVLTPSEIERIKQTYNLKGKLNAARELLDLLPKYKNWFEILLKCLKDRDLNLTFLIEHFTQINDDVHAKVYSEKNIKKEKAKSSSEGAKGKKRYLKHIMCKQKPEIPIAEDEMVTYLKTSLKHDDAQTSKTLKTLETQTEESFPDRCPCQVEFFLKDLNSLLDPLRKNNPVDICNLLNLLLGYIKPYRYCFKMLETKVLKYDLPGLFSSVCKMNVFLQMNMSCGIQIKQITTEIFVYFITSSNLICQKLLETDEFLNQIETEMDDLLIHLTLEDDSDEDLKAALVEIKRNMMHLLLAIVRHKTCNKNKFLTKNWKKIMKTLLFDDDHFVANMSLIVMSYILEGTLMIKTVSDNDLNPEQLCENLLLNLRNYVKYSIPSSRMKLDVFAYMEGIYQLTTVERFEDKILKDDTLDALLPIVQRLQDQKIDRTYLSLSSKVKASKTKDPSDSPCESLNGATPNAVTPVDNDTYVKKVFERAEYFNYESNFEPLSQSGDFPSIRCKIDPSIDHDSISHNQGNETDFVCREVGHNEIDKQTIFLQANTKNYTSNTTAQSSLHPDPSDSPCESLNGATPNAVTPVDNDAFVKNDFNKTLYMNYESLPAVDLASNSRALDLTLNMYNKGNETGACSQDSKIEDSGYCRQTLSLQASTKNNTSNLLIQSFLNPDQSIKQEHCTDLETERQGIILKKIIGKGNFATVWKGVEDKKVEVAVKMIDSSISSPSSYMHEVNIMSRLKHPNIIQLLKVVSISNPLFIVLEYMSKGDLKTFLRSSESKSLQYEDFGHIGLQVTEGMLYLEKMEIVHRDLRAQNVLVGEKQEIKISDFGIALDLRNENKLFNDLSASSFPIKWTAPEAAIERKFSSKSDVWSFGALMYEIITLGQDPYPDLPNDFILKALKGGIPKILPRVKPTDIPNQYWNMMQKCCRQEPANRPSFETLRTFFELILD